MASPSKTKSHIQEFDPHRVRPLPGQPRKRFKGLKELAASIAEIGQTTPGLVTIVLGDKRFDAQLVDGERRLRAFQQIGHPFRAEIRPDAKRRELLAASFGMNFNKQDHDCLEIAEAIAALQAEGYSAAQIGKIAGKSDCWVYSHLNLLKLHPSVQKMLTSESEDEPKLTFQLAQLLSPLDEARQIGLATKIKKGEGMSVAAARRMILKTTGIFRHSRGSRVTMRGLESLIDDVGQKIGIYLDMPGNQINQVIDSIDGSAKAKLIDDLADLAENLTTLAGLIEERMAKACKGAA